MGNFHKTLLQWKSRLAIGYRLWFHFWLKEGELLEVYLPEIRCFCLNQGKMGDWYFLLLFHSIFKWPQGVLIHIELFFTFPKISPKAEIYSVKPLIYLYKRKKDILRNFFQRMERKVGRWGEAASDMRESRKNVLGECLLWARCFISWFNFLIFTIYCRQ